VSVNLKLKTKLRGLSPRANYTDRDRRLSTKLVPTFADRGCHVVSVADPYGRILDFLDQSVNKEDIHTSIQYQAMDIFLGDTVCDFRLSRGRMLRSRYSMVLWRSAV
jgi:hypothetical protein